MTKMEKDLEYYKQALQEMSLSKQKELQDFTTRHSKLKQDYEEKEKFN